MAGFKGISWAPGQFSWDLTEGAMEMLPGDAGTPAVSRSVHYGLFLSFEGIRFFVREEQGQLQAVFMGLQKNIERFRRGISFNLGDTQKSMLPSAEALTEGLLAYLAHPRMREFVAGMARDGAQGYLRPFTVDADQSIGVTFPARPTIRVVAARYESYLGEPFHGVLIPDLVRAVRANGTGHLKLGINYLISIKAVQAAQAIVPGAASALFLDDRLDLPLRDRQVTEWDTSCALFGFRDGSVVKIPESPLILPSVTIQGIRHILEHQGVHIDERDLSYGELMDRADEVVTVCSIGTAGILNRCTTLTLVEEGRKPIGTIRADMEHPLYEAFGQAREIYWDLYRGQARLPPGLSLDVHDL